MSIDRTDKLVAVVLVAVAAATAGMLWDQWQVVYYSIPVMVTVFMLLGSLNRHDRWHVASVAAVLAFGGILAVLFVVAQVTLRGSGTLGGLPTSSAVVLYAIWPLTTVGAPLLYALVYQVWLRHDVEEPGPVPDTAPDPQAGTATGAGS
ncbi:hypothetical protein GCM10028784_11230 [Myceligenerans cantabricum]